MFMRSIASLRSEAAFTFIMHFITLDNALQHYTNAVLSPLTCTCRCSTAFFKEERRQLEWRRHKIRLIQQRKVTDMTENDMKDLPDQIPLPLVIGTEVTGVFGSSPFQCPCI